MTGTGQSLIERRDDLAVLEALLARARAGAGGLALVEAAAGLGKSRVLAEFRDRTVTGGGVRVLSARASELEQGFAFGVVRTLLAGTVRALAPAARERLLAGSTAPAAVALGLTDGAEPRAVQPSPALLDAIFWLVDGLCAEGPLVLTVDDAHWADGPSLRALAYLAHRADDLSLTLICALRPGEVVADPQAAGTLKRVAAATVTLAPLSAEGVAALAATAAPQVLDPKSVRALYVATQGSPFLVSQVIGALAAYGPESLGPGMAISPSALRGVIGGRMAALPAAARELARVICVLGNGAHLRDVCGLTGLGAEAVLEASSALSGAGIFADDAELSFAHPLLADAVGSELGAAERALGNLRAARWLAAHGADPERVAVHLGRSAPCGDADAARQLRAAAADALRRGAPEAAAIHLRRALAEPPPPGELLATTVELGLAELAAGEDAAAAAHLAPVLDDPAWPAAHAASAAWACLAEHGHVGTVEALLRAVDARRGHDDDAAVWLSGMAGYLNFFVPIPERRRVHLPPRGGLTGATAAERMALAAHLAGSTNDGTTADEAARMANRSLGQGALSTDANFQGALFTSGPIMALLYAERLDDAARELDHVARQARELAAAGSLAIGLFPQTHLQLLRGDVGAALAQAHAALQLASVLQGEERAAYDTFIIALQVTAALAHVGVAAAEAALGEHGLDGALTPMQMWVVPARAHVHIAAGRAEAAVADARAWRAWVTMLGDHLQPVESHTAEPLALALAGRSAEAVAAALEIVSSRPLRGRVSVRDGRWEPFVGWTALAVLVGNAADAAVADPGEEPAPDRP